jgi:hypothetical protein
MTSLEGWGSAIELRPRARWELCPGPGERRQRTGFGALGPNRPLVTGQGRVRAPTFGSGTDRKVGYGSVHGMWRSLVSAPALGAGGRRFESGHPDWSEDCHPAAP